MSQGLASTEGSISRIKLLLPMPDAPETCCPKCHDPMESGRVAPASGYWMRGATLRWIKVGPDGQEVSENFWGGEELAPHPSTNIGASPRFDAHRCRGCRLVLLAY